jgi:hypothetical protein
MFVSQQLHFTNLRSEPTQVSASQVEMMGEIQVVLLKSQEA